MIIEPRVRGFICTTAHPVGCQVNVDEQIQVVQGRGPIANGPKRVLVIGSSTGYGLSSRITAAFGCGARTVGVFFVIDPRSFSFPDVSFGWLFAALLGLLTVYFALGWATTGRTYGARLLGLRVVDGRGRRLRPGVALLRAIMCVYVPLVLFWVIFSEENRSAADILLRTSVVYDWAATAAEAAGPESMSS